MTFFLNSRKQRTHISLIVGNKVSARVKCRAILVSIHKKLMCFLR